MRMLRHVLLLCIMFVCPMLLSAAPQKKPKQPNRLVIPVKMPKPTLDPKHMGRIINIRTPSKWEYWQQTYNAIQTALITAPKGSIIQLPAGTFHIYRGLSIGKDNITLRGVGMNKTILTFDNQLEAAQALSITSNHVTVEDLTIQNASGDGIKAVGADHLAIRRVKVWWVDAKGKPIAKTENGSYGYYPVQCNHVLIEHSVAMGGSDSGIYIGQSNHVVLRHNIAKMNVAGIEVENSQNVDVYKNLAENNAGGILLFRLPLLPNQYGKNIRVFENKIINNNHPNFAPAGATVRMVPSGTGMMIVANNNIRIYKNQFVGHKAFSVVLSHFALTGRPIPSTPCCKDECKYACGDVCLKECRLNTPACQKPGVSWTKYNPCATGVYVHDNTFQAVCSGSDDPTEMIQSLVAPEFLFGGFVDVKTLPKSEKLCIAKGQKIPPNPATCIVSRTLNTVDLDMRAQFVGQYPNPIYGLAPYQCTLPPLPPARLR